MGSARGGQFTFSRLFTQGPNPLATTALGGHGFASFLLGDGELRAALSELEERRRAELLSRVYLQDDWRMSERLTINAGLRYDFDVPRTERYDRMSWFDPDVRSPLADVVPALATCAAASSSSASTATRGRSTTATGTTSRRVWAPRIS